MIQALKDTYLHLQSRQTNLNIPYSDYIGYEKYPEQNRDLLGQVFRIKYRDNYSMDMRSLSYQPVGRPADDYPFINRSTEGPEYNIDEDFIHTKLFKVIRADSIIDGAPANVSKAVMVSEDYKVVLVGSSSKRDNDEYNIFNDVHIYSLQNNRLLGLEGETVYFDSNDRRQAYTIAVDAANPLNSVIVETISDNIIRVLLGTEVFFNIININKDLDDGIWNFQDFTNSEDPSVPNNNDMNADFDAGVQPSGQISPDSYLEDSEYYNFDEIAKDIGRGIPDRKIPAMRAKYLFGKMLPGVTADIATLDSNMDLLAIAATDWGGF